MNQISPRIPRSALVTGAGRRIGRAIALDLAQAGFAVALHYSRSADEVGALAAEIAARGGRAVPLKADLAIEAEVAPLVGRAVAALGPLGLLVNNASTFERDEVHDATRASWDLHLEVNLRAPFVLSQAFAAALPAEAEGVIVNLLDQRVWNLTPHFVTYTVSKAGLWTLTQTLALALAPRIRVAGIGPGPALASVRQSPEQFAAQCASTPLGKGTSPAEIVHALRFILSSPSFTGQMLALDGGQHLQWAAGPSGLDE
ncbi:SDR family oxidoreductase [Magnetospirillum moscoviense]|uniref:Short-chain dehydrogenase n=1 Tax=Magnetospirillum moscoviense TaxID=1437059 RepID=A0A178MU34_9PROT|nr:SDR family oxidoreductase [Magnetospirillum moscoviense]OAN53223.1 short-chain dehydrogenase [Magnetospirillum moscoviense]